MKNKLQAWIEEQKAEDERRKAPQGDWDRAHGYEEDIAFSLERYEDKQKKVR